MIKAIIFDIGGVILDLDLFKKHTFDVFNPKNRSAFWEELSYEADLLCKDEITLEVFLVNMLKKHKKDAPKNYQKLEDIWWHNFDRYIGFKQDTIGLIEKLKPNYKLGIISNIIDEHAKHIRNHKVFKLFDDVIFSYEVKMAKGNIDIFKLSLERLRVGPKEAVFIDDVLKFVRNSQKIGIKGIQFKTAEQLAKELRKIEVKV